MIGVINLSPLGKNLGQMEVGRRRRRLSTIVKRYRAHNSGPVIAFVVPQGRPIDQEQDVVHGKKWKTTLVTPGHTVVIMGVVAGHGGPQSGGAKAGQIGLALAAIALAVLAPYAAPAIAGALGAALWVGSAVFAVVSAGIILGGTALLNNMTKAKANATGPLYSVSGGGNVAKIGQRLPVVYGKTWSNPDLTQQDYSFYDGDDVVLIKRLSVTLGKYNPLQVRAGDTNFWTAADGIIGAYAGNTDPQKGCAIEWLYGTASTIMPGEVFSSPDVTGSPFPRPSDSPNFVGPYPVCLATRTVTRIQVDFEFPGGIYATSNSGTKHNRDVDILFEYQKIDDLDTPIGGWNTLYRYTANMNRQQALRLTQIVGVAPGRYWVRAKNQKDGQNVDTNTVDNSNWDGLRGLNNDTVVRAGRTELVIRVRSNASLSNTNFSSIQVFGERILPVWNGSAWVEQPTSLAKWAFVDALTADYGGGKTYDDIDQATVLPYNPGEFANFCAPITGAESLWSTLSTILHPTRADVVKVGNLYSIVRDEEKAVRRHNITRRNIKKDSGQIDVDLGVDKSAGDVIVEINVDNDPKRPFTVRSTVPGYTSRTPKRMQFPGVVDPRHAKVLADWYAAVSAFRYHRRTISLNFDGRYYLPGDDAMVDMWFWSPLQAAQIESQNTYRLTLDNPVDVSNGTTYALLRDRKGKEWGPCLVTTGSSTSEVILNAADVTAAETMTGIYLADVIAKSNERLTPVTFGALQDTQERCKVAVARPTSSNEISVQFVYDDPRVWAYIGETIPTYDPPSAVVSTSPHYTRISARPDQHTSSLVVDWFLLPFEAGYSNEVALAYNSTDDAAYQTFYTGTDNQGEAPLRYVQGDTVYVRARATKTSTGEQGAWSTPFAFNTPLPQIQGGYVVAGTILDDAMALEIKYQQFLSRFNLLNDQLRTIAAAVSNHQADVAVTLARVGYERTVGDNTLKVSFDDAFEGFTTDVTALGIRTTTLEASINTPTTGLLARVTSQQTALATIDGQVSTLASDISTVEAGLDTTNDNVSDIDARVTVNETAITTLTGDYTALSSSLTTVIATIPVGNATASLRLDAGAGGSGILASITLAAQATINGHTTPAALTLRARDPGNGVDPPISEALVDVRSFLIGHYNTSNVFIPVMTVDSSTDTVEMQNLVVDGTAVLPGDTQIGIFYTQGLINAHWSGGGSTTAPDFNFGSEGSSTSWTQFISKSITLPNKSAHDSQPYIVDFNVSMNGQVSNNSGSSGGQGTNMWLRVKLNGTQYGPQILVSSSTTGSGGGTYFGNFGNALFASSPDFTNAGGTATLTVEVGFDSSQNGIARNCTLNNISLRLKAIKK